MYRPVTVVLLLVISACGNNSPFTYSDLAGGYSLLEVRTGLPSQPAYEASGALRLFSSGGYDLHYSYYVVTPSRDTIRTETSQQGSISLSGTGIQLHPSGAQGIHTGFIDTGLEKITLQLGLGSLVFGRD